MKTGRCGMKKKMYQVKYKVNGYPAQLFYAGPYSEEEVQFHKDDIAGYEGVHSVEVEAVDQCQTENI